VTRASWAVLALLAVAGTARAQDPQPLRLLIQADAGFWPSPTDDSGFRWRRIRVGDDVSGHDVHLRVLLEWQPDVIYGQPPATLSGGHLPFGGPVRMTEVFAGWAPSRAFELDAGALRVPFSRSRQIDEADLPLPERPGFIDAHTPDFRTGAEARGNLGEILYRVGFFSADQSVDGHLFGRGYLVAGRVVAEPIGPVGLQPWRRTRADPWFGWFRFAAGLSAVYGTLAAPGTLALDPEFTAQWRRWVISAEYLLSMRLASGTSFRDTGLQGAVVEPGVSLARGRQYLIARAEWQQTAGTTTWGAGIGVTMRISRSWRYSLAYERRWSSTEPFSNYWLFGRLAIAIE